MTEQEWLECADPEPMLEFLHGKASDRKLRLFGCACWRRIWHLLRDDPCRQTVNKAELFADSRLTKEELWDAGHATRDASLWVAEPSAWHAGSKAALMATYAETDGDSASSWWANVRAIQTTLVKDIFGNPFNLAPMNPEWITATVISLATAIYDDRAFDRLPILADALEDAGCTHVDMLTHCRQPGEHVRGCWPLDLLLGKQ